MKKFFTLLGLVLTAWMYCLADSSNGLVLHLKCDSNDTNGTITYDKSGYGNNGILSNGVLSVAGVIREGFDFNGTNSYVECDSGSVLVTGAFTCSVWVNSSLDKTQQIIGGQGLSGGDASGGFALSYYQPSDSFYFDTYDIDTRVAMQLTRSTLGITLNNWHFITIAWDGTEGAASKKMYVDGVLKGTDSSAGVASLSWAYFFTIAQYPANPESGNFKGKLDDVHVYNRELSAAEIAAIFKASKRGYIK